ncbi:non-repetitive nucleoporin protein [Rutstroemia sp. NJR-2017a BBW]|nr:non-repetitive nucleoporin protein [Rutstroemia sp. NJR-2017a BBW]
MAFPATPQRPLPGTYFMTPAAPRFNQPPPPQQPLFRPPQPAAPQNAVAIPPPANPPQTQPQPLQPIQRAARTINEVLQREESFPDLDSYVKHYEISSSSSDAAWVPFQKTRMYDIPDTIYTQYNEAAVSTQMGLFAELNHSWVAIDNALYLWDYTNPNPVLKGFEEQPNTITSVKLVVPRKGVFIPAITHLVVVATRQEIILLGVADTVDEHGNRNLELYRTGMSLAIKGIDVTAIEGSAATGRIFFAGQGNEVYELTYQNEDRWFSSKCGKINHTSPGYTSLVPTIWGSKAAEHVIEMVVDDTRRLLYTLSTESTIRTFHMDSPTTLNQVIEKKRQECLRDISHMITASPLLSSQMRIVSISPISAKEGTKLHLMATTTSGCRLYLSATRGYGYGFGTGQGAPQSMQVQHIRFPPRLDRIAPRPYQGSEPAIETASEALVHSRKGIRYPPGFFFCFVAKEARGGSDALFLSAPDTGRIAAQARDMNSQQGSRYYESAYWLDMGGRAEAIGLVTKPFAASEQPLGFGNELATQYDLPSQEVAIMTDSGVHIIRRRRLVDIFAAAIRNGGDEGLENEIKKFIRQYGRGEATATALAVACGQGNDASPAGEMRPTRIVDPETVEAARRAFVEHGGRPSIDQNLVTEGSAQAIDNVRPSSRHEGLALYMARLIRGLWKAPVMKMVDVNGLISIKPTIDAKKLGTVQDALMQLGRFLDSNKSFIEGLSGPEGLNRATSQQEDIALQGEHQALHSLQTLNTSIIEGISFVQMFFEERVDDIWVSLDDTHKQQLRELTFELLFSSNTGKDLAKVLVKQIVNRNIAQGSNVDTVAEALRRRCGSFCSPDDVIIFKAQEQLQRAHNVGPNSDHGRTLLNESLRLFQEVAGVLSFDNLYNACSTYSTMQQSVSSRKRQEAHMVVDDSDDEVFQYDLFDWYLAQGWVDRLIATESPFVIKYLERSASGSVENSDLLWRYYVHREDFYAAAGVQLTLAKSELEIPLSRRIEYLSRAKANASTQGGGIHRQARQVLLHEATELLDVANIQDELLHRLRNDDRIRPARKEMVIQELDGVIQPLSVHPTDPLQLFNEFADQGEYYDICLQIYQVADHRNESNILSTWQNFFMQITNRVETANANPQPDTQRPYETMINIIRDMAQRLAGSDLVFNPLVLIPLIEAYSINVRPHGPKNWVPDLLIHVGFSFETIVTVLEDMYYNELHPFVGETKKVLVEHVVYVVEKWLDECVRRNERVLGGEVQAESVSRVVGELGTEAFKGDREGMEKVRVLRGRIAGGLLI